MHKISIKFTVVSLFLFLSSLIILSMFYIQYLFSQEIIKRSINDKISLLSSKIEDNINFMDQLNKNTIITVSDLLENKNIDDFLKLEPKFIKIFQNILINNKNIYSTYVGFKDNGFFELINLNIDNNLRQKYNASIHDRWLFIKIINNYKYIILLDKNLNKTSIKTLENDYYSTNRPWYIKAMQEKVVIKTQPYNFSNIEGKGVTYAKNIPSTNNVFAFDLLINNLNSILKIYGGDIFENSYILDKEANLLASSSTYAQKQILDEIKFIVKNELIINPVLKNIKINNKNYIYSIVPLNNDFISSYTTEDKIINQYKEKINTMIFIVILMVLTIIPLIFYFSSIIVNPILLLTRESKKVKNRKFTEVKKIQSRVLEIDHLSDSLTDMSESICEYQTNLENKVIQRTQQLNEKNKQLEKLSVTDKLTGLYNRIKIDDILDLAIEQNKRYDQNFGIIIIDIDFFKSVNDTHGHQVGDIVLTEFAALVKNSIRKTDFLGRWGGEEFMIICSQNNLESIMDLANKIRKEISAFLFYVVKHKTASFGIATYRKDETLEKMINRADEALYLAKERGRNRVETLEN